MAEVSSSYSERPIVNYGVSGSKKKFYHASKEPKEGYAAIEKTDGTLTYHRYVDGLTGKITKVDLRDSPFGKQLVVFLTDSEQISSIQVGLDSAPYRVLIDSIFNAELSEDLVIKFYGKKDKNGKEWQNCYSAYLNQIKDGKNVMIERLDTKDCPQGKQKASGKWDFSGQEEWYYDRLQELIGRVEKFKLEKGMESKPAVKEDKPVVASNLDDLDF